MHQESHMVKRLHLCDIPVPIDYHIGRHASRGEQRSLYQLTLKSANRVMVVKVFTISGSDSMQLLYEYLFTKHDLGGLLVGWCFEFPEGTV